jgi:hypothetical protein
LFATVGGFEYYHALKVTLPEISDDIIFDKIYLGLKVVASIGSTGENDIYDCDFKVYRRGYYNKVENPISLTHTLQANLATFTFDSLPDEYYSTPTANSNKQFYYIEDTEEKKTGYTTFDLQITDRDDYKNIHELVILFKRTRNITTSGLITHTDYLDIFDMALIFEKSITIGSELYA